MNGICLIVLMLVTLSVNAAPYSTSAYNYKEQKDVILSDEAVAAYFKKQFEAEDIQPAVAIMEYLARLMKKTKGGEDVKDEYLLNAVCVAFGQFKNK